MISLKDKIITISYGIFSLVVLYYAIPFFITTSFLYDWVDEKTFLTVAELWNMSYIPAGILIFVGFLIWLSTRNK